MGETSIEWTDATWNPTRGCSRVNPDCDRCYAMGQARRQDKPGKAYHGLTVYRASGPRRGVDWSGAVRIANDKLDAPLRWRKPRRIFVNSMSDLFHESLFDAEIDRVWAVMWLGFWHTYQILTKRPKRARQYLSDPKHYERVLAEVDRIRAARPYVRTPQGRVSTMSIGCSSLPRPWIWLGVSAGHQKALDAFVPELLATPAAVRFVSAEPLLGPIDFTLHGSRIPGWDEDWKYDTLRGFEFASPRDDSHEPNASRIDWCIVGGESGHGARPCDVAWIRSIVEQCSAAGVPAFVKQLGAAPVFRSKLDRFETFGPDGRAHFLAEGAELVVTGGLRHRKGADIGEWPEELRVREFPEVRS